MRTRGIVVVWLGAVVASAVLRGPDATAAGMPLQVVPVPYAAGDPSIPHLAYPGRDVVLKAVVRGGSAPYQVRWDVNFDGVVDATATLSAPGDVEWRGQLPSTTVRKLYRPLLEVADSGTPFGKQVRLSVVVDPRVPAWADADSASPQDLLTMKEVARTEALWLAHKALVRGGSGAAVFGYPGGTSSPFEAAALHLLALLEGGHFPAYEPGTYVGPTPPAGLPAFEGGRWQNDPYAEDALRLTNYLLMNLQGFGGIPAADEADDLQTVVVPNTNEGTGLYLNATTSELNPQALALEALARTRLAGSNAQVGVATGRPMEYVVQQMVDYAVAAQADNPQQIGGWYGYPYLGATGPVSSYFSGAWYAALQAAVEGMGPAGVYVNLLCRDRAAYMLLDSQDASGAPVYVWPSTSPLTFETAGLAVLGCRWLGWDQYAPTDPTPIHAVGGRTTTAGAARQAFDRYVGQIARMWNTVGTAPGYVYECLWSDGLADSPGSLDTLVPLSFLAVRRGGDGDPGLYAPKSWFRDLTAHLVEHQEADGSFRGYPNNWAVRSFGQTWVTALAARVLAGNVARPVALGTASTSQVVEGCSGAPGAGRVSFSHAGSFGTDPTVRIVTYEWAFDVADPEAPSFGTVDFRTQDPAALPTHVYEHAGTWHAALRVTDASGASDVMVVGPIVVTESTNLAPVVDAGGPYEIVEGSDLLLEGVVTDPNQACDPDEVASVGWNLDADTAIEVPVAAGFVSWEVLRTLPVGVQLTITLTATDVHGLSADAPASLTILPIPNEPPTATTQAVTTREDTEVGVLLSGTDADGDPLTYEVLSVPGHGSLRGTPPHLTYLPDADWHGSDSFLFRVHDGFAASEPAVVSITVTSVNDRPETLDPLAQTTEDTPVAVTLLGSDADGQALSWIVYNPPAHGTVTIDGSVATYTPAADWHGTDYFHVQASDGVDVSLTPGRVTVHVISVNDAPVATDLSGSTHPGVAVVLTLAGTDVERSPLTFRLLGAPSHGSVTVSGSQATYVSEPGYVGEDPFTYVAHDGTSEGPAATVSIDVVNRAPVAHAGTGAFLEATGPTTPVALDGTGSSDPDGHTLTYAWSLDEAPIGEGAMPTVWLALGTHEITLTVQDPWGGMATDTVSVTVEDTTAATFVTLVPSETVLKPANGKMVDVTLAATAADLVDAAPTFWIQSVESSDAVTSGEKGDDAPDWEFTGIPGDLTLRLRAERLKTGDGRVYTLTVGCRDASGNVSYALTTISVPEKGNPK